MCALDEMPNGHLGTVKKDWTPNSRLIQNFGDTVGYSIGPHEVRLLYLNQDAQGAPAVRERHKSLGVCDRRQSRFDSDTHAMKQADNGGSVPFREIDRRIIG